MSSAIPDVRGDVRSGALAAWTRAWLDGTVSLDQAVDAVTGPDAPHRVTGHLPALPELDAGSLTDLLVAWRRGAGELALVLPAPGDVRGLPGPADFREAALDAAEAVVGGGLGAYPEVTDYYPSSAPSTVVWQVQATGPAPHDFLDLGDAQYELTTAIRDCADALATAEVAGGTDGVAALLGGARRAGDHVNLPPGHPPRAVALLAQTQRLQAVLDLAGADPHGGATDTHGVAARDAALRPLATAVRRARVAAYNAPRTPPSRL